MSIRLQAFVSSGVCLHLQQNLLPRVDSLDHLWITDADHLGPQSNSRAILLVQLGLFLFCGAPPDHQQSV